MHSNKKTYMKNYSPCFITDLQISQKNAGLLNIEMHDIEHSETSVGVITSKLGLV